MKHTLFIIAAFWFAATTAFCQSREPKPNVYFYVEQMPKAGYDYQQYLNEHIKYPEAARASNVEGRVIVRFIVNEDGSISDCTVMRGIGSGCDEEALRVVKSFPAWSPGRQAGKPVSVYYTLPIVFRLNGDEAQKTTAAGNSGDAHVPGMPTPGYDVKQYIAENVTYPMEARKKGIEGRVLVKFVVNEDGHISDGMVVKGIGGECDKEALRVIKNMPPWKPDPQNPKRVFYTLPVSFKLNGN